MATIDDDLLIHARATISRGSLSFASAARLFDPATRRDVMLLYCWCRHCDDVTDGQHLGRQQPDPQQPGHGELIAADRERLEQLRHASLAAADGCKDGTAPYRALAEVVERHRIERELIEEHLRGFELDVAQWRPESSDDTLRYSYHVAGSVGVMMARMMGVRESVTLARGSDLGIAFQLTNIARDVVQDARVGRCYLPRQWLEHAALTLAQLPDPACHDRLFPLVIRLLQLAEPYYLSARTGIRALPPRAAWAIAAALDIYRDIGLNIIGQGPAGLARRSRTGRARKLYRLMTGGSRALASRWSSEPARPRTGLWTPVLPENR